MELPFVDVLVLVQGTAVTTDIYYKTMELSFVDVLVLVQGTAVTTDIYYKTIDSHL